MKCNEISCVAYIVWSLFLILVSCTPSPHIVMFLIDDLGHYNVGWRNPEIKTPTLDALATKDGLILDRHYTFKFCSPSRSSFLSGRLPIHVNQRNGRVPDRTYGVDLRMTLISEKLKEAGYKTHQIGKWHAGAWSVGNLPVNRGFDSSFGYLNGAEDHYTQWAEGAAVDLWVTDSPGIGKNGTYNPYLYFNEIKNILKNHDTKIPLFLYIPLQNVHDPLEVEKDFLDPKIAFPKRQKYAAMAACMDESVANFTKILKNKGMWDNTLLVLSADNGGDSDSDSGAANNYPLRGSKYSDFEGGTRTAAFVSGGFLPKAMRGKIHSGNIHLCDWYATFCHLAGVDPTDSPAGVPPIDSINVWDALISGNLTATPRREVPLSYGSATAGALIIDDMKLVIGTNGGKGIWTGPQHPNGTKDYEDAGCPKGCLFNVRVDPTEHNDLATTHNDTFQKLHDRYLEIGKGVFQTGKDGYDGNYTECITQQEMITKYHGFWGPLCFKPNNSNIYL